MPIIARVNLIIVGSVNQELINLLKLDRSPSPQPDAAPSHFCSPTPPQFLPDYRVQSYPHDAVVWFGLVFGE